MALEKPETTTKDYINKITPSTMFRTPVTILLLLSSVIIPGHSELLNPRIVEHPEDQYVVRNEPATVNCKAEGDPTPSISWYRNGELVITANDNPASHRMLLPSGQLFFLRVAHGGKVGNHGRGGVGVGAGGGGGGGGGSSDVGVYYCNATNPVTGVSAISRNASLLIAMIRDEFREQPADTDVATGDTATLHCKPPRGDPDPRLRWKKEGVSLPTRGEGVEGERVGVVEDGRLEVRDAKKEDSGLYTCVAHNPGGQRESRPARLAVIDKPRLLDGPRDVSVSEGSDAVFQCKATGDPEPTITWSRLKEFIPEHRSRIMDDKSLRIKKVKVQDEGVYICRVGNTVGWQEAEFRLTVLAEPTFLTTPRSRSIGVGRKATFECSVTGNPLPAVFWKRENKATLLFPEEDYGRFSVSDDGTLVIDRVQKEDAGEYVCQAQSIAGSAAAKAKLDVKDSDSRPPPLIQIGPQNQTLPISSMASLQCVVSGDPLPAVRWYKNDRLLTLNELRFALLDSGTLQIAELRRTDTGLYTCRAVSETGESSWSAALLVEPPTNPSIIFRRTPEPSTYPGSPSRPTVTDIRETSVRLTWKANPNNGASVGWLVASDAIKEHSYIVQGLTPNTAYRFLVRAQNSHGISVPSPVTNIIKTKGDISSLSKSTSLGDIDLAQPPAESGTGRREGERGGGGGVGWGGAEFGNVQTKNHLSSIPAVHLFTPDQITPTSVTLKWEVKRNQRYIEGFHIKYSALADADSTADKGHDLKTASFAIHTVLDPTSRSHVLDDLEENTRYLVFIQPFFQSLEGTASNTVYAQTLEAVPSTAPVSVWGELLDNDTLYLTWQPPQRSHHNGPLLGYKIYLRSNSTPQSLDVWSNGSNCQVFISGLSRDGIYSVQVAAHNRVGLGPATQSLLIGHSKMIPNHVNGHSESTNQPWLWTVLILCIGSTLWLGLCTLVIVLYRRRAQRQRDKNLYKNNKNNTVTAANGSTIDPLTSMFPTSSEKPTNHSIDYNSYNTATDRSIDNTYENISSASVTSSILKPVYIPDLFPTKDKLNSESAKNFGAINSSLDPFGSGIEPFYQAYIIKPKDIGGKCAGVSARRSSENNVQTDNAWTDDEYNVCNNTSYVTPQPQPPIYMPRQSRQPPSEERNKYQTTDRVAKKKHRNSRLINKVVNNTGCANGTTAVYFNNHGESGARGEVGGGARGCGVNADEQWVNGHYHHFEDYVFSPPGIQYCQTHSEEEDNNTFAQDQRLDQNSPTQPVAALRTERHKCTMSDAMPRYNGMQSAGGYGDNIECSFVPIQPSKRVGKQHRQQQQQQPQSLMESTVLYNNNSDNFDDEDKIVSCAASFKPIKSVQDCHMTRNRDRDSSQIKGVENGSPYATSEPGTYTRGGGGVGEGGGGGVGDQGHREDGGKEGNRVVGHQRCFSDSDSMVDNELRKFYAIAPPSPAPEGHDSPCPNGHVQSPKSRSFGGGVDDIEVSETVTAPRGDEVKVGMSPPTARKRGVLSVN